VGRKYSTKTSEERGAGEHKCECFILVYEQAKKSQYNLTKGLKGGESGWAEGTLLGGSGRGKD